MPTSIVFRVRRNLEAELPPQFLKYLESQKFSTISQFRRQFHVTNPVRARAILQGMLDKGLIVTQPDPRPGKKGMVFVSNVEEPKVRRGRGKSAKFYDLQEKIVALLQEHPEGARFGSIPQNLGVVPNDATFIKALKDLVQQGTLTRTELGGKGKAVLYSIASLKEQVIKRPVVELNAWEILMNKYELALDRIESLQKQVDQLKTGPKPQPTKSMQLPDKLQERLKKLQARDNALATKL